MRLTISLRDISGDVPARRPFVEDGISVVVVVEKLSDCSQKHIDDGTLST